MPVLRNAKVIRLLLAGLMLGAIGTTAAVTRDVRMHGPNGEGGGSCPDTTTPAPATTAPSKTAPETASHGGKTKPVISVRGSTGGDDGSSHSPRWHSFLPGMFR